MPSMTALPGDTETPPEITVYPLLIGIDQSVGAASLFTATGSNAAIVDYAFEDLGGSGGFFTVAGVAQPAGQWIVVPASELDTVSYIAGPSPGSDTLCVSAFDGNEWASSVGTLIATAAGGTAPVASAHNFTVGEDETVPAASLFVATDPGGAAITQYSFEDLGGGGYFTLNGVAQPNRQPFVVAASELGGVAYIGGASPGSDTLQIAAFNGADWSSTAALLAMTSGDTPPVVTGYGAVVALGQAVPVFSLFQAADPDGDSIAQYGFKDLGGGGHFALNGVAQPNGQWIFVPASELADVSYVAGSSPGGDTLCISASDGAQWSSSAATSLVTATGGAGPIVSTNNVAFTAGEMIPVSSLFAASDATGTITEFTFRDVGENGFLTGPRGYFVLDGVPQPIGQPCIVAASELGSVSYVANYSGGDELLNIEASDSSGSATNWLIVSAAAAPPLPTPALASTPRVATGQPIPVSMLFSVADSSTIVEYAFKDTGTGVGDSDSYLAINGVAQPHDQWIFVPASDLGNLTFVGGPSNSTDTLWVSDFDGTSWASSPLPPIEVNSVNDSPAVTLRDFVLSLNQSVPASSLFWATAPSDKDIVQYVFVDADSTGYFALNGEAQPNGTDLTVAAGDLGSVTYVAGASPGSDWINIVAIASDGTPGGAGTVLTTVTAMPAVEPVNGLAVGIGQTAPLYNWFEGYSPTGSIEYAFKDLGGDGGYLALNGIAQPDGEWMFVPVTDLELVSYVGGTSPGQETLCISATPDGTHWSSQPGALAVETFGFGDVTGVPGPGIATAAAAPEPASPATYGSALISIPAAAIMPADATLGFVA